LVPSTARELYLIFVGQRDQQYSQICRDGHPRTSLRGVTAADALGLPLCLRGDGSSWQFNGKKIPLGGIAVTARRTDQRSVIRRYARRNGGLRLRLNPPYALSPNDPEIDLDEFKRAVDVVEQVRKNRR